MNERLKAQRKETNRKYYEQLKLNGEKVTKKQHQNRLAKAAFVKNLNRKVSEHNFQYRQSIDVIFSPDMLFKENFLVFCGKFMSISEVVKILNVSKAISGSAQHYIEYIINSSRLHDVFSNADVCLPARGSAMYMKVLFEVNRWDDILVLDRSLKIKVTFESPGGRVVNTTQYTGHVLAFVNGLYMIYYEDYDIRYETQSFDYLLQFEVDENGLYVNDPVV